MSRALSFALAGLLAATGCAPGSTLRAAPPEPVPGTEGANGAAPGARPGAPEPAPSPAPTPRPAPASPAPTLPSARRLPDGKLSPRRIGSWSTSGYGQARRQVIRDAAAWSAAWSLVGQGPRPPVDFGREAVIVAALGERQSGGYQVQVSGASLAGGTLLIDVLEVIPGADCVPSAALTQPIAIVAVPAGAAHRWNFREHTEVRDCR